MNVNPSYKTNDLDANGIVLAYHARKVNDRQITTKKRKLCVSMWIGHWVEGTSNSTCLPDDDIRLFVRLCVYFCPLIGRATIGFIYTAKENQFSFVILFRNGSNFGRLFRFPIEKNILVNLWRNGKVFG